MLNEKPRAALTRERVVQAAVELADAEGLDALGMRRLGRALGVEAMSLYHYISGKEDLLDGMVDLIFGEIDRPVTEHESWIDAMREHALAAYGVITKHRWAVSLLDSRTSPGPATLRHFDDALGCLRRGGFTVERAVQAYAVIYCYVYGFALTMERPEHGAQLESVADTIPPGEYPYATEVVRERLSRPGYNPQRDFVEGLDLVLGGLAGPDAT